MKVGILTRAVVLFFLAAFLPTAAPLAAQDLPETLPDADPADVVSVDAIVAAVYDVISGPAGEERNWDRWRSLFLPEARLISVGRGGDGSNRYRVMSPEDYVQGAGPSLEETGFFEDEIGRTQEEFGPVVHLFSTYESRRTADDPEPFMRGINSFQLFHDGTRWWVVTIYWTGEGPDLPIPEKYLDTGGGAEEAGNRMTGAFGPLRLHSGGSGCSLGRGPLLDEDRLLGRDEEDVLKHRMAEKELLSLFP